MTIIVGLASSTGIGKKYDLLAPEDNVELNSSYTNRFLSNVSDSLNSDCSLCLEKMLKEEELNCHIAFLRCGHFFHLDCFLPCNAENCPLCREPIINRNRDSIDIIDRAIAESSDENAIYSMELMLSMSDNSEVVQNLRLEHFLFMGGLFNRQNFRLSFLASVILSRLLYEDDYRIYINMILPIISYDNIFFNLRLFLDLNDLEKILVLFDLFDLFLKNDENYESIEKRFHPSNFRFLRSSLQRKNKMLKFFNKKYKPIFKDDSVKEKICSIKGFFYKDMLKQRLYFLMKKSYELYESKDYLGCYEKFVNIEFFSDKYPSLFLDMPNLFFTNFFQNNMDNEAEINCTKIAMNILLNLLDNTLSLFNNINKISHFDIFIFLEKYFHKDINCARIVLRILYHFLWYYLETPERSTILYHVDEYREKIPVISHLIGENEMCNLFNGFFEVL